MLEAGELFEHYERSLRPRIRAVESHRRALLAAWRRAAALVGLPALVLYVTAGGSGPLRNLTWLAVAALLAGLVLAARLFHGDATLSWSGYRERFKRDIVSEVFRLVQPRASYLPKQGVARSVFDESGLFTRRVTSYASDDLVRGRIGDVPFEAADVQASYTTGSGKQRKTWEVLRGLYLRLDFNKHLRGRTIVEPESAPEWRMGPRVGLPKVTLEDPDFERRYAVYAKDPVEARYVLTPLLMERILSLEAQAGHPLHLSFLGNHVHLAVHYGRALFEPSLVASVSFEAVEEIAQLFGLAELIVAELELNVRIWTKGEAGDALAPDAAAPAPPAPRDARAASPRVAGARIPVATSRASAASTPARAASPQRPPSRLSRQEVLDLLPAVRGAGLPRRRFFDLSGWIGLGVGLAAYSFVAAWMKARFNAPDAQGIVIVLAAGIAGLAAGIAYSIWADSREGRQRLLAYAIGVAVVWFGFLVPLGRSRAPAIPPVTTTAAPRPTPIATPTRAERAAAAAAEREARATLVEHLRDNGAHGPLGVVPPVLQVRPARHETAVTNLTDVLLFVELARVIEEPAGSGRYKACELYADPGRRRGRYDGIKPHETVRFRLMVTCASSFAEAPIEYRVGRSADEVAWWSDTALASPEGHPRPY